MFSDPYYYRQYLDIYKYPYKIKLGSVVIRYKTRWRELYEDEHGFYVTSKILSYNRWATENYNCKL